MTSFCVHASAMTVCVLSAQSVLSDTARLKLMRASQTEVRRGVSEGKTRSEISLIPGRSFFAVKTHRKEIFKHLGVHNRTAAVLGACRAHIAETHPSASPAASTPPSSHTTSPSRSQPA